MKNWKKTLSLLISLMLLSSCFGINVLAARLNDDQTISLTIIHTNDLHSRYSYSAKDKTIGFAKLKTIINQEEADLIVDAGDIFHGQSFATIERGGSIAELMAAVGYDAMAVGNHDFNYGQARLLELGLMANTKILGINVVDAQSGQAFFADDYLIKTITAEEETIKVGVFGIISPDVYSDTAPANVQGLTFGTRQSTIEKSQDAVDQLKAQGCEVIVALAHVGDSDNGQLMRSDAIARGVVGIDVIIDGHTHDVENRTVAETLIVQTGAHFSAVGEVELTLGKDGDLLEPEDYRIQDKKASLIGVDQATDELIPADPQVAALTSKIEARQDPLKGQVVGTTPVKLGGDNDNIWQDVRLGELNLGRVVTDSYRFVSGADVAIENAGGIRAEIPAGEINKGQVIDVLPFGNYLVTKQVSGQEIRQILETSIEIGLANQAAKDRKDNAWPSASGSYLQWSGINAEYDLSKEPGERVYLAKIGGADLDHERLYTIACNSYLSSSDKYPALQAAAVINDYPACDESFITYLQEVSDERFSQAIYGANIRSGQAPQKEAEKVPDSEPIKKQTSDNPKTGHLSWRFTLVF